MKKNEKTMFFNQITENEKLGIDLHKDDSME